ncbi:hypothetical protein HYV86_01595 [Candidatus Woesearchaeota archaeon]|nr:hypothetical protein [Candidatus Woesearchaeota archaeon]
MALAEVVDLNIVRFEYEGKRGVEAIECAYTYVTNRLLEGRDEKAIILDNLASQQGFYGKLFDLYFSLHPDQAQIIVEEHQDRFKGWCKIMEPLEKLLWTGCKTERYKAALRRGVQNF